MRLAAFADAAAASCREILGRGLPAGVLRWTPEPGSSSEPSLRLLRDEGAGEDPEIRIEEDFSRMAGDFGFAYANGYARWVTGYAVASIALSGEHGAPDWVDEGAALYLTDLLARREHATTPVLYSLTAAYTRLVRRGEPVRLSGAAADLDAAGRGKAYGTFRLLEALYGREAVGRAIGRLAADAGTSSSPEARLTAALRGSSPDPAPILEVWTRPEFAFDAAIRDVRIRDDGLRLEATLERRGRLPVTIPVEVRCVDGETVRVDVPAGDGERTSFDVELPSRPVEVRVDPDRLLPDVDLSNNGHGFGSAASIRRFYGLDSLMEIGELHFSGEVELRDDRRAEEFDLVIGNLQDRPVGLGVLVSASWIGRPGRTQRALFLTLEARERRRVRDVLLYPARGGGRAQIEARYWRASDVEEFRQRLLKTEPELVNAYIVRRDPPRVEGSRAFGTPWDDVEVGQPADSTPLGESGTDATDGDEPTAPEPTTDSGGAGEPAITAAAPFSVHLRSPTRDTPPVGTVEIEAEIEGAADESLRLELFVNEQRIRSLDGPPFRAAYEFDDQATAWVVRAVALDGRGRVASDTVVLDRGGTSFGAAVDLVTLHATVRDPAGRYVRGLRAEDFQVLEEGTSQRVVQFDFGETPVSVALLLDTSSSMIGGGIGAERDGAARLVRSLVDGRDRAMILGFNDRLYHYAGYTGEVPELLEAIDNTVPDGSTALFDSIAGALRKANQARGKRALVVLSDGLDTRSDFDYADVLEYTRQSDVLVYTIGLQLMHEGTELGDASKAVRRGVEQLQGLAESSGGAAYFPLQLAELEEIYKSIAEELSSQYALSYYPSDPRWDGRWREVTVQVRGHPDYRVQTRPGYYAVAPDERGR